jgi:hypothetical protein
MPSLSSALTSSSHQSASSSTPPNPCEQALWAECGNRPDFVATEAAEKARAKLRKARRGKLGRDQEDAVVQQATGVRYEQARLVNIRPSGSKMSIRKQTQCEAGPSTERQEKKTVGTTLPWEAVWHKPRTAEQDEEESVPHPFENSFSTLSTLKYSISDALNSSITGRPPPPAADDTTPTHAPATHHRVDSLIRAQPSSPVDSKPISYQHPASLVISHRRQGAISHHNLPVVHSLPPTDSLTPDRPASLKSTKSVSFGATEVIPGSPIAANKSTESVQSATGQRDVDDEEIVDDWYSCYSEPREEEGSEDWRSPLLDRYMGRC